MKSCFGYVRVSTLKQGEGVSLEAQKDAILAYAAPNKIAITRWFEEKETAAKAGRPVFGQMLKLLNKRVVDGVVLHRPDRAARNFADWAKIGDLADAGIDVHFASETLDFRSRGGRLSADIQAVIAADYIRNLKEEIHKGQQGQLNRGIYPFSAPLGYCNNGGGNVKTIDPIKGPMVRRVFESYASGVHSYHTLLKEIDRIGLRSHTSGRFSKGSLEAMLNNPFYAGIIKIKKYGTVFQGRHEALISPSLFERVQEVRRGKCGKKSTKHMHMFAGLFVCQHCKTSMIGEKQKGYVYYRCHTPRCETKTIREEELERAIFATLSRLEFSDEASIFLTSTLAEWAEKRVPEAAAQTSRLQIEQIAKRLERLTDALIDHMIDTEVFNERKQRLLLEKARLEEVAQREAQSRATPTDIKNFLEHIKNLALFYKTGSRDEKRAIIKNTTSNRRVSLKNPIIEPAKWLLETVDALAVLLCADTPPDSRRSLNMHNMQALENLNNLAMQKFEELDQDVKQ